MTAIITIVQSTRPTTLCKHYAKVGGKVQKTPIANVTQGICTTHVVATTNDMASVLAEITASRDLCIVPGVWRGAGEEPFDLVTEEELCRLTNGVKGDIAGGVHVVGERRLAARLKRGIEPSDWLLLDADNPPGIPDHWASMNMAQRLVMLEPLIPGISKCERIELRGSSARVMNGSGNPGQRTHGWVRVNRPDLIEVMRARVAVDMVNKDLSFKSARYSRQVPGQVIGHERRTVLDLAVWISGRIVFNAQPHLGDGMAAYTVADADITIVNEGGGVLDISAMTVPARPALGEYQARTGVRLQIARNGAAISIVSNGQLTMDTEIESAGTTKPLSVWVQDMRPGDKLRCEAPFRASQSEAAVVILRSDGVPLLHDVGNSTTYHLAGTADADVLAPDWPEPSRLPDALPAVKPFDPELLPEALRGSVLVGDAAVEKFRLVAVAVGLVVLLALLWLLNRTKIGLLIRAGVQDREMVESLGYRIRRLFVGVFAAGSALAGLGGALWGMNQQIVVPQIGGQVNVLLFIVIIIGGLGSTLGCLVGALVVGLLTNYVGFLAPKLTMFSSIGLMVAVLIWRPQGLYPVTNR